ncbi:MAG: asparagine synthase (glutamine-hydrolyzing) [Candidatus Omnitrophota bacterium]
MGIIAGIFSKDKFFDDIKNAVQKMMEVQKYRDQTKPIFVADANYAISMANQQNYVFEKQPVDLKLNFESENIKNTYAFVDGVVLDVPKHRAYFVQKGYKINHNSCSAIVACAYQEWGTDFMKYLEGEFACVVFDSKEKKIILVRDPYGHKPLHYYHNSQGIIFSSEIKGILASGIKPKIDMCALSEFLSLNCIPYPRTIFENIEQVCPGNMVIFSDNGLQEKKYSNLEFNINTTIAESEAIDLVTQGIKAAVQKRIVGNNVFCFLSGGIDSSALLSFASELTASPVNAISIGFDEAEVNELEYAKLMAKHVGAKHQYFIAKPDSFFNMLNELVWHHDQPFTDTSAYPTYYAAKLARGLTDVILTGDGPDQTMGGSGHHVFAFKNNLFTSRNIILQLISRFGSAIIGMLRNPQSRDILNKIRRKMYRDSLSGVTAAYDLRSFFPDIIKKQICSEELWQAHCKNNPYNHPEKWFKNAGNVDAINKYLYADVQFYVPDDLMIKVDRMCMAHGLETLSPFQDVKLAEIVNSIPGKYKIHKSDTGEITTKYILKEVCQKRFPAEILNKKKQGFGIPLEKWLRSNNGQYLRDILFDSKSLNRGFFKKKSIIKFVNDFINEKGDYYYPSSGGIVALLTFELWAQKYYD